MKNLKQILSTVFILSLITNASVAQVSDEMDVEAKLEIPLVVTAGDVAFGTIQVQASGGTAIPTFLAANSNDNDSENIGNSASPGTLTIQGAAGATVQLYWEENAELGKDGLTAKIPYVPSVYNGSSKVTQTTVNSENAGAELSLNNGSITLDVGGSLDLTSVGGQSGLFSTAEGTPQTFTVFYN